MLVDESMSGWRPKTKKLGGLPNYIFKPRKHVPLGTMFRNGVECITGASVVQDVVQNPEQQSRKVYHGDISALPKIFQEDGLGVTHGLALSLQLLR